MPADTDGDALDEADAAATREFELNTRDINDEQMDMSRSDEVAWAGVAEVWGAQHAAFPDSFHIHHVQFLALSIDGEAPPLEMAGRKNTVGLEPGRGCRLLMRFGDYADPHVRYMYHGHMLLHEDEGMMGQLVVIEPGQEDQVPSAVDHDHHEH